MALKIIVAALPLLALHRPTRPTRDRAVWILAWAAAAILTIYGLVLTTVGLLVKTGVIHSSATADHRAQTWHTYLWDPWFLVWGLLAAAALLRSRHQRNRT